MTNPNDTVIAEFHSNSGKVTHAMGGALSHLDLALLHHTGQRSGRPHITPLAYMPDGDGYLLVGSFAGAAKEPRWVENVESAETVTVEIGTSSTVMRPLVLRYGSERDALYEGARKHWPFLLEYEKHTSRAFPVIRLSPLGEETSHGSRRTKASVRGTVTVCMALAVLGLAACGSSTQKRTVATGRSTAGSSMARPAATAASKDVGPADMSTPAARSAAENELYWLWAGGTAGVYMAAQR
jgi:deazaflavin-dependent oxidoreductase (nitroreductase family)